MPHPPSVGNRRWALALFGLLAQAAYHA